MHYFPDVISSAFSVNQFFIDSADVPVGIGKQEVLKNVQTDETGKMKYKG